eukprot:COSAG05_NODE_9185_length_641_cov_1.845018_1_plen_25_part_10
MQADAAGVMMMADAYCFKGAEARDD